MAVKLKEGSPSDENWKNCLLYEDAVQAITNSLKRKPHIKPKDKLWVVHHFARMLKVFVDKGEFFEWCRGNQTEIVSVPWGELRRELALIMNLLMELEAYAHRKRKEDGTNQSN
jgi:hypothetical protein